MFKRLPALFALGAALMLVTPKAGLARVRELEHHNHRFSVMFGVSHRHYPDGHYNRWGYWRPNGPGYYDQRGYWHSRQ